jgi:serine/threonine-protein kinase RsbW
VRPWERRAPAYPPTVVGTLRRELVRYAESAGAGDDTCHALALAVSEALTNVVQHAYVGHEPGAIVVDARLESDDRLIVRVCDEGVGLVPRADSPGLGLGLGLMAQMADEFSISNRQDTQGTIVTLGFSVPGQASQADDAPAHEAHETAAQS